jgi:hypothetical protein
MTAASAQSQRGLYPIYVRGESYLMLHKDKWETAVNFLIWCLIVALVDGLEAASTGPGGGGANRCSFSGCDRRICSSGDRRLVHRCNCPVREL